MKFTFTKLCILFICWAFTLSSLSWGGPVRKKIAIQAGTIIPITGKDIKNGTILIEDGKITTVGKKVDVPWDAFVIEAPDRVVMPGFVLAHTYQGMDRPNERIAEVPFLSTFDAINPLSTYYEDALRDGVVAMLVLPGNDTLLGGTGTVVSPYGRTVEDMLIQPYTGLKISLLPTANTSRMGHMQRFRRYMVDLDDYLEQYNKRKEDAKKRKEDFTESIDPRKQSMLDLQDKKLKAFVYCPTASDVLKALEIKKTYNIDITLVLGVNCYQAASMIAESKVPVILDPTLITWETNKQTNEEEMKVITKIFHKAGVQFALTSDSSQYGQRYLWYQAATAVKHGMKRADALKAITLNPARFMGLDKRFGSIQAGKDASLIFLTGDPLDADTWVDQVMIGGEIVYEKAKDNRLRKLLASPRKEAKENGKQDDES